MNSADDQQRLVEKLKAGVETWNRWRAEHPTDRRLNLTGVNLSGANLSGVDLSEADLIEANLSGTNLSKAKLYASCLTRANLSRANLSFAGLNGAVFMLADLSGADLGGADLRSLGFLLSELDKPKSLLNGVAFGPCSLTKAQSRTTGWSLNSSMQI